MLYFSDFHAGAVHSAQDANGTEGEERSIGSIPQGFFDVPAVSGEHQVGLYLVEK